MITKKIAELGQDYFSNKHTQWQSLLVACHRLHVPVHVFPYREHTNEVKEDLKGSMLAAHNSTEEPAGFCWDNDIYINPSSPRRYITQVISHEIIHVFLHGTKSGAKKYGEDPPYGEWQAFYGEEQILKNIGGTGGISIERKEKSEEKEIEYLSRWIIDASFLAKPAMKFRYGIQEKIPYTWVADMGEK